MKYAIAVSGVGVGNAGKAVLKCLLQWSIIYFKKGQNQKEVRNCSEWGGDGTRRKYGIAVSGVGVGNAGKAVLMCLLQWSIINFKTSQNQKEVWNCSEWSGGGTRRKYGIAVSGVGVGNAGKAVLMCLLQWSIIYFKKGQNQKEVRNCSEWGGDG
ncbi:hypothetical protein J6590_078021 [Homalodisca vitripennis]|nr:hypothetical protein J6590_078021 [Homalodisca vitripennis]